VEHERRHVQGDGGLLPTTPVEGLWAVYPGGSGRIIHLYAPKFRTQKPRSESYPSSVCGVIVSLTSGAGREWERPTGRVMVEFATALELERRPATPPDDPRPKFPEDRRFCGKCIGVWLERHRLLDVALDTIAAAQK